ncbi:MAG: GntR family transcriptional regulator [Lactobacillus sp.]|jgi:GntR family transcriptional regulator|nr:GntR family transcriptional regulator [Lactobacillus sp.]MCI2033299.1 GntR family transcriptional regulator [Lactobacillus sp.]
MPIIIQHNTVVPIYEQIVAQFRQQIADHDFSAGDALPSVRRLARDLQISALTVKKAYDQLEQAGLIQTVQGKGSFVAKIDPTIEKEQQRQELEATFDAAITRARQLGLTDAQIRALVALLLEEAE